MNTSKVKKIAILSLIIGLIFIQVLNPKVNAEALDFNNLFGNQMGNEIGNHNNLTLENNTANNAVNNQVNNTTNRTVNNTINKVVNNNTNKTTLPKTGANENILITLMVICAISGVYAYRKVKEYNM